MAISKLKKINFTTWYITPIFLEMYILKKCWYLPRFLLVKKAINTIIGYLYNDSKVQPLHIMLLKTSAHVNRYDGQTKWIYFLIEDDDLLKNYNTIWDKVSADLKKEFDSEPVYNKEYLKTKIKFHSDEVSYFYDKKFLR